MCVCVVGLLNSRICVQFLAICHPPPHASLPPHNAVAVQAGPIIKLHRATHTTRHSCPCVCVCVCVCGAPADLLFFCARLVLGPKAAAAPLPCPLLRHIRQQHDMTSRRPRKTWETNTTPLPACLGAMCKFKNV